MSNEMKEENFLQYSSLIKFDIPNKIVFEIILSFSSL